MTNASDQPLTRRALRLAERAGQAFVAEDRVVKPSAPGARRAWASRAAVLAAVATATIVSPLAGASAFTTAPVVAEATPEPSVVNALSTGSVEISEATALEADPGAETRALTTASRGYLREALECPVQSEANGPLSAVMGGEEVAPTLIMPVAEGTYRLTSSYGYRTYPFAGMHEGTDFAGSLGTPLYAVADGTVIYAGGGRDGRSGQIVIIRAEVNGGTYDFWYGHMYTDGVLVAEGQEVAAGQQIAEIGNNGNSTGPHLHFEVHDANDQTTDPLAFLQANGAQPVGSAAVCA